MDANSKRALAEQSLSEQSLSEQSLSEQLVTEHPLAAAEQIISTQTDIEPPVLLARESQPWRAQETEQDSVASGAGLTGSKASHSRVWLGNSDTLAAIWLFGSMLCLALALGMRVGDNRRVYFLDFPHPIPETCIAYSRFGIDCPGCGLTRTFVHVVHGQLLSAWQLSPVGLLVFAFACAQIPLGVAQLLFRSRHRWVEAWGMWNDYGIALLLVALLLQWLVRCGERWLT